MRADLQPRNRQTQKLSKNQQRRTTIGFKVRTPRAIKDLLGGVSLHHRYRHPRSLVRGRGEIVQLQSTVTLSANRGKTRQSYTILSTTDTSRNGNFISADSPLGSQILGKHLGERVSVSTPYGIIRYTISQIDNYFVAH